MRITTVLVGAATLATSNAIPKLWYVPNYRQDPGSDGHDISTEDIAVAAGAACMYTYYDSGALGIDLFNAGQWCKTKVSGLSTAAKDMMINQAGFGGRRLSEEHLITGPMSMSRLATCGDLKKAYNGGHCCPKYQSGTPTKLVAWRRIKCNDGVGDDTQSRTEAGLVSEHRDKYTHLSDHIVSNNFESFYNYRDTADIETLSSELDADRTALYGSTRFQYMQADYDDDGSIEALQMGDVFATCGDLKKAYDDADCCATDLDKVTHWHRWNCNVENATGDFEDEIIPVDQRPQTSLDFNDWLVDDNDLWVPMA